MKLLAYMSHPIGVGNGDDMVHRQDNIANAAAWIRFLVTNTRWAISCPWYPYVVALDGERHRPRGLVDNIASLRRCDLLLQVGGNVSPHMRSERDAAMAFRVPVVDLTDLGYQPPWSMPEGEVIHMLSRRASDAVTAGPRAAWMTALTHDQEHAVRDHVKALRELGTPGDHVRAVLEQVLAVTRPYVL